MIGTKLAHYEIKSRLGIGGMGEVYRATDTRLARSVAIKILPAAFAADPDRLARFRREAQLLASLNHPNIAQIYGVEEAGETRCIVMELVEGQTLQERIRRGPIPVAEALEIARQIAEALETAHEKGIIHRDLKPGNVMLTTDGKVKVLDFGLAKAFEGAPAQEQANSPTLMSMAATSGGVILGTAGYMSPEQARGHATDQRSDVFSLGCVLYEMLTGRETFPGETVTDIIACVVAREPDYSALPSNLHGKLKELLVRCLAKDRKKRWHAIADIRLELESLMADPNDESVIAAAAPESHWKRRVAIVAAVLLTAAVTVAMMRNLRPQPEPKQIARYAFNLSGDQVFTRIGRQVIAVSHDGSNLVYVANNQLYLKATGEMDARPIPGSNQDVSSPAFSPDGRWIVFIAVEERKLKKIPLAGGTSVTLADMEIPFGISWSGDDQIFVGQRAGIVRVRGSDGRPETVIAAKSGEMLEAPQLLPDGQHLLFSLRPAAANSDASQIVVQNLKSGERKVIIGAGSDARYVSTGHLLYAVGATVLAVPFDLKTLQATGGPVPMLEGVRRASLDTTGAAFFDVSDNGMLAFVPGGPASTTVNLVLANRDGGKKALPIPPNGYDTPRISPDGKHIAVGVREGNDFNIWIYDVEGNTSIRRLTFGGRNQASEWTPDGKRLVFRSDRDGEGLYWQLADGSATAERLSSAEKGLFHSPASWAPDKKDVIFYLNRGDNSGELWVLTPDGDRKPKQFVATPANAHRLSFSPDGRWMAYGSNEEGRYQVYVQPYPPTGAKYKITRNAADSPLWTADGRQLIFESERHLAYVDVQTQSGFAFGEPKSLPIDLVNTQGRPYDVTPDGKQFLVMQRPVNAQSEKPTLQINMALNWFEELKQRVPVR